MCLPHLLNEVAEKVASSVTEVAADQLGFEVEQLFTSHQGSGTLWMVGQSTTVHMVQVTIYSASNFNTKRASNKPPRSSQKGIRTKANRVSNV